MTASIDVFDDRDNLVEEIDRFEKLDAARAAYDAALRKYVLTLRLKAMVLRRSRRHELPAPPECLSPYACEEWQRLGPVLLGLNLLTVCDLSLFAIYCQSFGRWRAAQEALRNENKPKMRQTLTKLAHESAAAMVKFGEHLGLSPASRARLNGQWPPSGSKFTGLLSDGGPPTSA
jgi:P27 family predicted phage terminase small subunit